MKTWAARTEQKNIWDWQSNLANPTGLTAKVQWRKEKVHKLAGKMPDTAAYLIVLVC